jgi:predicted hotdog family 3-hydroxylacyl-ACP dehydratase
VVEQVVINAKELAKLLPHSGTMCLLDSVQSWDERVISCRAVSHYFPNNPLRNRGVLPIHAGIEYAAQAMVVHGSLCKAEEGKPKIAYLAVLTGVEWYCARLDDIPEALTVIAERQEAVTNGFGYRFSLHHNRKLLLEGRAVVALQDG